MKKMLLTIVLSLVVGFILGKYFLDQYDDGLQLVPTFKAQKSSTVYVLQYGVYSNYDSMKRNVYELSSYVYQVVNDKYYVFVGITKSEENLEKLENFFKQKEYSIYVKELNISNSLYLDLLDNYDELLAGTDDFASIQVICNQVLEKYNEVINENKGTTS